MAYGGEFDACVRRVKAGADSSCGVEASVSV